MPGEERGGERELIRNESEEMCGCTAGLGGIEKAEAAELLARGLSIRASCR